MSRILVIDDNDQFREALSETLKRSGYEVLEASNGKTGVDLYRNELPALIITDILMPEKAGTEVIFELMKDSPDIKIIAISGGGQGNAEDYLSSIRAMTNIKYTFEKPFPMGELLEAIKDLLG